MKRLVVLFLLVLLPLQIVWAASGACCGPDEEAAARHVCHGWQKQCDEDADDGGGDGVADGAMADDGCDCCHHFCGGALVASSAAAAVPPRLPQAAFDPPHYTSHIQDLVPPPDRPSRA